MISKKEQKTAFLKTQASWWWWVKNPENLSDEAMLEGVLNYGEFVDIAAVFQIIGLKKAAEIFKKQSTKSRVNYRPQTLNYFKLYFEKYAQRNS